MAAAYLAATGNKKTTMDNQLTTSYSPYTFMSEVKERSDGLEATRVIRSTVVKQPVIIALTANTMAGDEAACLDAGMDDYLGKPVKLEELTNKLEKCDIKS